MWRTAFWILYQRGASKKLRHILENLNKKRERKESFSIKCNQQKGHEEAFDALQRFWSKLNESIKLAEEN